LAAGCACCTVGFTAGGTAISFKMALMSLPFGFFLRVLDAGELSGFALAGALKWSVTYSTF
jgi:hypothetical protein